MHDVTAPVTGTVISVAHQPDEEVRPGEALVVLESMKMEHEVLADVGGLVRSIEVELGQTVEEGAAIVDVFAVDVLFAPAAGGIVVLQRESQGVDPHMAGGAARVR